MLESETEKDNLVNYNQFLDQLSDKPIAVTPTEPATGANDNDDQDAVFEERAAGHDSSAAAKKMKLEKTMSTIRKDWQEVEKVLSRDLVIAVINSATAKATIRCIRSSCKAPRQGIARERLEDGFSSRG